MSEKDEIGWVIERYKGDTLLYWDGHGAGRAHWTSKNDEAIRFARKHDAEVVLHWLLDSNGRSVEHLWVVDPSKEPV